MSVAVAEQPDPALDFRIWVGREHSGCCPFCGGAMRAGVIDVRTRAHFVPRGHPDRANHAFIFACHDCNGEQGRLTLDEWLIVLIYREDPRTRRAMAVVKAAMAAGLLKVKPILQDILDTSAPSSEAERPAYTGEVGIS